MQYNYIFVYKLISFKNFNIVVGWDSGYCSHTSYNIIGDCMWNDYICSVNQAIIY
jgi:hypothetical protein